MKDKRMSKLIVILIKLISSLILWVVGFWLLWEQLEFKSLIGLILLFWANNIGQRNT